jgi:opacity protein-like surface antigen
MFSKVPLPMNRFLAALFFTAAVAPAQTFSFGAKGGVPLTDFMGIGYPLTSSTTNRYIIGVGLEARLSSRLAVEFDILYRHLNYRDSYFVSPLANGTEHVTAGDWELPLLLKYRLTRGAVRPYVSAGPALDALSVSNSFVVSPSPLGINVPTTTGKNSTSAAIQSKAAIGPTAGFGLDIHAGALRFSPEIRYTYWVSPHSSTSKQNQAEFLLGISF